MLPPIIIWQQTCAKTGLVAHAPLLIVHTQLNKTSLSQNNGNIQNPLPALWVATLMSLCNGQPSSQMEKSMSPESECFKAIMVSSKIEQFQSPVPNAEYLLLMAQKKWHIFECPLGTKASQVQLDNNDSGDTLVFCGIEVVEGCTWFDFFCMIERYNLSQLYKAFLLIFYNWKVWSFSKYRPLSDSLIILQTKIFPFFLFSYSFSITYFFWLYYNSR